MVFGLAGSLPYLGTSIYSVYLANQAGQAASGVASRIDPAVAMGLLDQAMSVQMTYGAVMLGFLGAIHWGLEFAQFNGAKGAPRLLLGLAPTMVGWATLALDPSLALVAQWAGFTGLWLADMRATAAGWSECYIYLFLTSLTACSSHLVLAVSLLSLHPRRHLHHRHARRNLVSGADAVSFCSTPRVT